MLIGLLSGAAIGCVWGWLLGSCASTRLKRLFWTVVVGAVSATCIGGEVEILASRSALLAFLVAGAVVLSIRGACDRELSRIR
jgi:hypothetical protein